MLTVILHLQLVLLVQEFVLLLHTAKPLCYNCLL